MARFLRRVPVVTRAQRWEHVRARPRCSARLPGPGIYAFIKPERETGYVICANAHHVHGAVGRAAPDILPPPHAGESHPQPVPT